MCVCIVLDTAAWMGPGSPEGRCVGATTSSIENGLRLASAQVEFEVSATSETGIASTIVVV